MVTTCNGFVGMIGQRRDCVCLLDGRGRPAGQREFAHGGLG